MHIVAAGGLVTNSQGKVLLIKSPRFGDWEFPGGQVEEGETIPHALEREVFEETGIVVRVKIISRNLLQYTQTFDCQSGFHL